MRVILILVLLANIGCERLNSLMYKPYTKYKINGQIVSCRMEARTDCGFTLWDCANDSTYRCLYSLEIVK